MFKTQYLLLVLITGTGTTLLRMLVYMIFSCFFLCTTPHAFLLHKKSFQIFEDILALLVRNQQAQSFVCQFAAMSIGSIQTQNSSF